MKNPWNRDIHKITDDIGRWTPHFADLLARQIMTDPRITPKTAARLLGIVRGDGDIEGYPRNLSHIVPKEDDMSLQVEIPTGSTPKQVDEIVRTTPGLQEIINSPEMQLALKKLADLPVTDEFLDSLTPEETRQLYSNLNERKKLNKVIENMRTPNTKKPATPTLAIPLPPKFIHSGTVVDVSRMSLDNIRDTLEPAVYAPFMDDKGIHMRIIKPKFEDITAFGNEVQKHVDMCMTEYRNNGAVSLIALGQQGSGKSMTCEQLCNRILADGLPVIYLDADIPPALLHNLVRDVAPCVVFIDEFDKRYNENDEKERLLTMFSDATLANVSFIVAGNEKFRMSRYLLDRPSRFKYLIQFQGISPYIVEEMCAKYKISKACTSLIMRYTSVHHASYDVVQAVVRQAATVKSNIDQLIKDICYMNVPRFSPISISLNQVTSEQGMVSGVQIRQSKAGYEFTVIHEDGSKVELKLKELTNEHFSRQSFTIDTFRFEFNMRNNPYKTEDSLADTTRYTVDDVTTVTIDPGQYRTFELKSDDGESKVVSQREYQEQHTPHQIPGRRTFKF